MTTDAPDPVREAGGAAPSSRELQLEAALRLTRTRDEHVQNCRIEHCRRCSELQSAAVNARCDALGDLKNPAGGGGAAPATAPRSQNDIGFDDLIADGGLPEAQDRRNTLAIVAEQIGALMLALGPGSTRQDARYVEGYNAAIDNVLALIERAAVDALREAAPATAPLVTIAVWKCRWCGCLWRDNLDATVSLFDAQQKSCVKCEAETQPPTCEIHWISLLREAAPAPAIGSRQEALRDAQRAIVEACDPCGGQGWTIGIETGSGHACDGTDEDCSRRCPVPVPVEVQERCEYCGRPVDAIEALIATETPAPAPARPQEKP